MIAQDGCKNQGAGQHDSFVGLHGQRGYGMSVFAQGERPEVAHRLQVDQVPSEVLTFIPVILAARISKPAMFAFDADFGSN